MKPKSDKNSIEDLYSKYYVPNLQSFDDELKSGCLEYPSPEIQEKRASEYKKIDCTFRFVNELVADSIRPLFNGDKLYPFSSDIPYKKFFGFVHPAFLSPYQIYAGCAYQTIKEKKVSLHDLNNLFYQIEIPIKLPGEDTYCWYLMKGRILANNENYSVIRHANLFTYLSKFKQFIDRPEHKFIEGQFIFENQVNNQFQEYLISKVAEHYKANILKTQDLIIIKALASGKEESLLEKYTPNTISSYKRDTKELIDHHTGYKFKDILEAIDFLKDIGVISLIK
jgi:hypothetical protein